MADFLLSRKAEADLGRIADYAIAQFGVRQARSYRDGLLDCFRALAAHPGLGRRADQILPDLSRFEHESHVVFFRHHGAGILIIRVLHRRMDVQRHL